MTTDFAGRTKLSTVRLFISTGATTLIPLAGSAVLSVTGEDRPAGHIGFVGWMRRTIEKLTGMPYDQVWLNGSR